MLLALGVCGSPRKHSNTEVLLDTVLSELESLDVEASKIALRDFHIEPCRECRYCIDKGSCCIDDDMTRVIIPKLLRADIIIVASPVFFNNVTSYVKAFMDRTWCIRGKLRNKVGGGIVVGRGYGLEQALAAIHAFMLKHEIVLGHRGVSGVAFEYGEIHKDARAMKDVKVFAYRLQEIARFLRVREENSCY